MPRVKPKSTDREPGLVAELRLAILEARVNSYQLALRAGIDEAAVRKFVARQRSLSLDSAARLVEALGLKMVRPARPRKFPGRALALIEVSPQDGLDVLEAQSPGPVAEDASAGLLDTLPLEMS
jgi:hypothetical protein